MAGKIRAIDRGAEGLGISLFMISLWAFGVESGFGALEADDDDEIFLF